MSTPRGYSAWFCCQSATKSVGRPVDRQRCGFAQPWPGQPISRSAAKRRDLQDQRGGIFRRFVRAGRQHSEIGQRQRQCECRGRGRIDDRPRRNGMPASRAQPWRRGQATAASRCRSASAAPPPSRCPRAAVRSVVRRPDAAVPAAPSRRAPRETWPAPRRPDPQNPAMRCWHSCAHVPHGEELHARCRRLRRGRVAPCLLRGGQRFDHLGQHARLACGVLQHRIGHRGQFRRAFVASGNIGVADEAAWQCARVQRVVVISPRLNGAPPPPMRPRTITSPASGPRSRGIPAAHAPSSVPKVARRRRAPAPPSSGGGLRAVDRGGSASGIEWSPLLCRCLDS